MGETEHLTKAELRVCGSVLEGGTTKPQGAEHSKGLKAR